MCSFVWLQYIVYKDLTTSNFDAAVVVVVAFVCSVIIVQIVVLFTLLFKLYISLFHF